MIRFLKDKPLCFKNMDDVPLFYEMSSNGIVYANAALDFRYPPNCLFHLEVHRWNHGVLKRLMDDWQTALVVIKGKGATRIVATKAGKLSDQKSYTKLLKLFGFCDPVEFTVSEQYIRS